MSRKVSAPLDLLFGSESEAIDSPKATKAVQHQNAATRLTWA